MDSSREDNQQQDSLTQPNKKMQDKNAQLVVLGTGSWGTAQAHHLRNNGYAVTMWGRDLEVLEDISHGHNHRFLPELSLASGIKVEGNLQQAVKGKQIIVIAVPSNAVRSVTSACREQIADESLIISSAKGMEKKSLQRMSEVLAQVLGRLERIAVLSGPSFARELVQGLPTAVTIASPNQSVAERACALYHHGCMRAYSSTDLVGVELGGVLKNVIALAAGIVDGYGMGYNARAALLTRGLAEIRRIVLSQGGRASTVTGLSGLGDLLLTATGELSRNRQVGLRLGKGESLQAILSDIGQVAEGVLTAASCLTLAQNNNIDTPIIRETCMILNNRHTLEQAVSNLLSRSQKREV